MIQTGNLGEEGKLAAKELTQAYTDTVVLQQDHIWSVFDREPVMPWCLWLEDLPSGEQETHLCFLFRQEASQLVQARGNQRVFRRKERVATLATDPSKHYLGSPHGLSLHQQKQLDSFLFGWGAWPREQRKALNIQGCMGCAEEGETASDQASKDKWKHHFTTQPPWIPLYITGIRSSGSHGPP